jgi:hypothetical protein
MPAAMAKVVPTLNTFFLAIFASSLERKTPISFFIFGNLNFSIWRF